MKFRIETMTDVIAEVETNPGPDVTGIGVSLIDDDGKAWPLVWVDDFWAFVEAEDEATHDATVYLHLGKDDPEDGAHFNLPQDHEVCSYPGIP